MVDVSRDSENADQEHEPRVRTACESLADQGADEATVAAVHDRLSGGSTGRRRWAGWW